MTETALTATVYAQDGTEAGTLALPPRVFAREVNTRLLGEAVVTIRKSARSTTSHAKGRGEKRGGGKKPWRQKGTGRARHGSIRSPIWRGGGVTHGPVSTRTVSRKVNKKVKEASLAMALSGKLRDGEVVFVRAFSVSVPSAKEVAASLSSLLKGRLHGGSVLIVTTSVDENLALSVRNIPRVATVRASDLTAYDVLSNTAVVITEPAVKAVTERFA